MNKQMIKNKLERISKILWGMESVLKELKKINTDKRIYKCWDLINSINEELRIYDDKCYFYVSGPLGIVGNFTYDKPAPILMALCMLHTDIKYRVEMMSDLPGYEIIRAATDMIQFNLWELATLSKESVEPEKIQELVKLFKSGLNKPSWGYRLKDETIDQIYRGIQLSKNGDVIYVDYYWNETHTASISAMEALYAVGQTFSYLYAKTIYSLNEHDKTGQWCPVGEWQTLTNIRVGLQNCFY